VPEIFKPEKIVVLNIENITVHPNFVNGKAGQEIQEANFKRNKNFYTLSL
jgi:hypothetical protein